MRPRQRIEYDPTSAERGIRDAGWRPLDIFPSRLEIIGQSFSPCPNGSLYENPDDSVLDFQPNPYYKDLRQTNLKYLYVPDEGFWVKNTYYVAGSQIPVSKVLCD